MSVDMITPAPRKSSGFTIDSIIGNNDKSESKKESTIPKDVPVPKDERRAFKPHREVQASPPPDMFVDPRDGDPRRGPLEDHVQERLLESDFHRANHFLDPLKHLQGQTPESLKHLHDVLSQTAGATGTYIPAPRMCRHPLSTLNVHSMYPVQHLPQTNPLHPLVLNPGARDIRGLHPYLADRYSAFYFHRYPAAPGFLFQPYRKPKRIRTAFSPSQLLQLEKAFEKSHYVVGQERKDLASDLQLTETQVKVWFQNRRTKHKRIRSEDGSLISDHEGDHGHDTSRDLDSDVSEDIDVSDDEDHHVQAPHC